MKNKMKFENVNEQIQKHAGSQEKHFLSLLKDEIGLFI
jgi:hypothetical protein